MNNTVKSDCFALPKSKARSSNFELLRIISMILIVAHHYSIYSEFNFEYGLSVNKLCVQILTLGGKLGVNCFVLITGYFSVNTCEFKWKSIIKFIYQITVFSVIMGIISFIVNPDAFSVKNLISIFLPFHIAYWWFANSYLVFLLFIPLLSIVVNNISKKMHLTTLMIMLIIWSILPTFKFNAMEFNNVGWFICLFLISAYIKKYPCKLTDNRKLSIWIFALSSFIIVMYVIICDILGPKYNSIGNDAIRLSATNMFPLLLQSISLFLIAKNTNIGSSKAINKIASCMFGIYLLHDYPFSRKLIWVTLLKCNTWQSSPYLVLSSVMFISLVFVSCAFLSFIYNITFGKFENAVFTKVINFTDKALNCFKKSINAFNKRGIK